MSAPKVPKIEKAQTVINAQTGANQTAAQQSQAGSMVGQNNPFGNIKYTQTGVDQFGNPQYESNINFSPEQQALFDQLQGTKLTAGQAGGDLLASANYGQPIDLSTNESSVVSQNLGRWMEYMNPSFDRDSENLDNQLRNQGLVPGTTAYDRAMSQLRMDQNRAKTGALAEMQPEAYRQSVNTYQLPLMTSSMLAQLGAPGDVNASMIQTPQFNMQAANATGAYANQQNAQMEAYKQKQAMYGSMLSGIAGIGGTILGGPLGGAIGSGLGGMMGGGGGVPTQYNYGSGLISGYNAPQGALPWA